MSFAARAIPLYGADPYPNASVALDFVRGLYKAPGAAGGSLSSLPGWSFSRTGVEYALNSAGLLVPFSSGTPAITDLGLQVWEARTNLIRNNTGAGGSAGVDPTNWAFTTAGLTRTIVGVGTENGWPYVEIRYNGTTNTTSVDIKPDGNASISGASTGQTYTWSAGLKLSAGSLTNVTDARLLVNEYSAGPVFLRTAVANTSITPTSAIVRPSGAVTTGASTTILEPIISVRFASGVAVDFTLRVYVPQLELAAFVGPVIGTTSASATRGAASASVGGLTYPSGYTIYAEGSATALGTDRCLISADDGTTSNRAFLFVRGSDGLMMLQVDNGGVNQFFNGVGTAVAGNTIKMAARIQAGNFAVTANGATPATGATGTLPTVTKLGVGALTPGNFPLDGLLRRAIIYPTAMTNSQLQQMTA